MNDNTDDVTQWSNGKLDIELLFANLADDGSPECKNWIQKIENELADRLTKLSITDSSLNQN